MDDSSEAESNPDDEPVTLLRRSARLASHERYYHQYSDSSSEDTADQVKEKATTSKRQQDQKKSSKSSKKRPRQLSDDSDSKQEQQAEEAESVKRKPQKKKKSKTTRPKVQTQDETAPNSKRLLRKAERTEIIKSIKALNRSQLQVQVIQQLQRETSLSKVHVEKFIAATSLMQSLLDYHVHIFIDLYEQGKEKYLRFQIDWHTQCSVFYCQNIFRLMWWSKRSKI